MGSDAKFGFDDAMKLGSALMTTGQMIVQSKQNQGTPQAVNRRQMRAQKLQRRRV